MTHVASVGPSKTESGDILSFANCSILEVLAESFNFFSGYQFKAYFWNVIYWLQKLEDKKSEEVEAQVINNWWFDGR